MKKISFILLASCFVLFANCQTKSKTKKTAQEQPQSTQTGEVKVKYRLVISFTSIGSGIDLKKYETIEAYVKNHAKKPVYDNFQKGREGEREICLQLKELTKDEQTNFIAEVKKLAEGSDRVKVNENYEVVKNQ